jgi:hypothetical protein
MPEKNELLDPKGFTDLILSREVLFLKETGRYSICNLNKAKKELKEGEILVWSKSQIIVYYLELK